MRFLKSKPRRSLYKLRLKFVQTTAEVSRKYYVLTNLSTRTHKSIYVYLRKCLPRTYFGEYVVLISCCCYRRAPTGRYSCIAQGASPGLIIGTHLLSPKGAVLPRRKTNARVRVPLLRSSILHFVRVSPGFHFGLCPHCTLGYARVSCLKALVLLRFELF